jgi:hypothetical protein
MMRHLGIDLPQLWDHGFEAVGALQSVLWVPLPEGIQGLQAIESLTHLRDCRKLSDHLFHIRTTGVVARPSVGGEIPSQREKVALIHGPLKVALFLCCTDLLEVLPDGAVLEFE